MLKTGFRGERKGNPLPVPLPRRGGTVTSHLFGKPPNPRRGTSWERRQTSPFSHTPLSRCTYPVVAGYLQREDNIPLAPSPSRAVT